MQIKLSSTFPRLCFMSPHFYKISTLFCFCQPQKSKKNFPFYKKRQKIKNNLQCVFGREPLLRQCTPQAGRAAPPSSFPENYTPHLSIKSQGSELCLWASMLYLDLFCAYISNMCPKLTASSLYTILAYESFQKKALLLHIKGKPVMTQSLTSSTILKEKKCIWDYYKSRN